MDIVKLELSHYNFYCPATGELIMNEDSFNDTAKSLKGAWHDSAFFEPLLRDEKLSLKWDGFVEKNKLANNEFTIDYDAFESFLEETFFNSWVVFRLTQYGISCGPSSSTAWLILDLDTLIEEIDEETGN